MRMRADLALFAQDRWAINRLTLNYGLRFDYFNGYVPEQSTPASTFVPARQFAEVRDVPNWKDFSPRMGASYDLFGNGRTALRMTVGRYVFPETTVLTANVNPIITSVNSVNRTWNDTNGNFVPDCNLTDPGINGECGAFQNVNFGNNNPNATRYADDVTRGYGVRPYNWDVAAEVQHELRAGVSVTGGYYHNWFSNFTATNNLAVTPVDYSPFCVTAPSDARLPNGGGYQVCGLYDVSPSKLGRVTNLVTQASNFGEQKLSNDFFNVNITTRLGKGVQLGGGVDTGRTKYDNCIVISNPQEGNYARLTGALNMPAPPGVAANVPTKCSLHAAVQRPDASQGVRELSAAVGLRGQWYAPERFRADDQRDLECAQLGNRAVARSKSRRMRCRRRLHGHSAGAAGRPGLVVRIAAYPDRSAADEAVQARRADQSGSESRPLQRIQLEFRSERERHIWLAMAPADW